MIVSREVAATTPPSRPPRSWKGEGEVLGVVPLLRAEGCEDEAQIGLVLPEDVRPSEAEPVILPRTPDEPLVVDVARGLDSGSMIEQAHRVFMQAAYCVGHHWEKGNVKGFVWSCVFAILSGGLLLQDLTPDEPPTSVCVCVRVTSMTSSQQPITLAR